MTAITAERCDKAMKVARKNGRRLEKEVKNVQASQAFLCSRQGRRVIQAECHDCFLSIEPSLRLLTNDNRQRCIEIHTKKGRVMNKDTRRKTPSKAMAGICKTINSKNAKEGDLLPVGARPEIPHTEGTGAGTVVVTKEMYADRDAALNYAADAAKSKVEASLKLALAVALYAGDDHTGYVGGGSHLPWVIDNYESFKEAVRSMFGLKERSAQYYRDLGRALIKQYGKENVLQKASALGISQVPYHKLREFLQAPKQFEQFLSTGHFEAADGKVITVDDILKNPVGQLPLLFERFTEEKTEKEALPGSPGKSTGAATNALGMTGDVPKALLSAKETEERIHNTLTSIYENVRTACITMQKESEIWPENSLAVINASEPLRKTIESIRDLAARINSALYAAETEPDKIPEIIGYMVEDSELHQLAEFRLKLSLPGWCHYHNLPETAVQEIAKAQDVKTTDSLDSRTFARFYSEWKKNKGN